MKYMLMILSGVLRRDIIAFIFKIFRMVFSAGFGFTNIFWAGWVQLLWLRECSLIGWLLAKACPSLDQSIDRFYLRLNMKSLFRGAKHAYKCWSYAIKHPISHKTPEKLVVSFNDIEIDSGDLSNTYALCMRISK